MAPLNWAGRAGMLGGSLFPAGWEEAHQPVVAGSWTAKVRYWSGPWPDEPDTIYDRTNRVEIPNRGRILHDIVAGEPNARIQQHPTPIDQLAGEQEVTTHRYLVVVPKRWDDLTLRGWIEVLESSDGQLVGDHRWLRPTDLMHGSLRWERDLICTLNLH